MTPAKDALGVPLERGHIVRMLADDDDDIPSLAVVTVAGRIYVAVQWLNGPQVTLAGDKLRVVGLVALS